MTKNEIRDKHFGYNEDITKVRNEDLIIYIEWLEGELIETNNIIKEKTHDNIFDDYQWD
jgi:hypothetical protein